MSKALPSAGGSVTIYDVAERAGVGIATVSRVLRGSAPVREPTRERVLRAVAELGFRPSHLGTSLAQGRHAANGIVFPDLSGPYYAEVLLGYEETASRLGQSVLVQSSHWRRDAAADVLDLADRVDGMVLLGRTVDDAVVARVVATGTPVVLVARDPVDGADCLRTDNAGGAAALAEHVAGHAYRDVRFLGLPDASPDAAARWHVLRERLGDVGVVGCGYDEESGRQAAATVLDESNQRDGTLGLVCANDEIALGAVVAVEHAGLRVGVDVAITGWDDVMAARHARPALTTVRQPMRTLGATAAEALDERVHGRRTTPRHDVLATDLVVRHSCGCSGRTR